jgi:hypothetical protein
MICRCEGKASGNFAFVFALCYILNQNYRVASLLMELSAES